MQKNNKEMKNGKIGKQIFYGLYNIHLEGNINLWIEKIESGKIDESRGLIDTVADR